MRTSTLAVVAAVSLAMVAIAGGAAAGSAASTSPHDNGIGINYTVGLPNDKSHQPGASSADIRHYAAANGLFEETSSPDGFKRLDTLTIYSQDVVFGTCSTENTKAFGIDRDNDSPGTKTDEGLLAHRKNSAFNEHSIYVNFFGEGSLAGDPVSLQNEDQVVAAQEGCYGMPSEPGWYQINARINGTGYNGNYIDTEDQGTVRSHYFYVCDCASEQEAREKLGPPPSEDGGGGGSESTATPTATATPESSGDDSSTATATATATATPTATATATPTATEASGGGGGGGESTATATATEASGGGGGGGGGDGGGGGGGGAQTATATEASGGGGGQGTQQAQQGGGPATPTAGAGPGFGLVAALGGVLAAALLALRRD